MEENLPVKSESDFLDEEAKMLAAFREAGMPGLITIKEHQTFQWFSLYMADKSYQEIADITKAEKSLILYMAQKLNWFEKKLKYYNDVQGKISDKLIKTKVKSLDFMSTLAECYGRVYGAKLNTAIMNNDFSILDKIDPKQMSVYFKTLEMMQKLTATPQNPKQNNMNVNVNVGNESSVRRVDDNTLVITPGNQSEIFDEMLQLQKEIDEES